MSKLDHIVSQIHKFNPDFSSLFSEFLNTEASSVPFFIEDFPVFGGRFGAISLRSGVFLSESFKTINSNNYEKAVFIILHETGHFKRYDTIDYDMVSLTKYPLDKYIQIALEEERQANKYALSIIESWIQKTNQSKEMLDFYKESKSTISYNESDTRMYGAIYNVLKNNKDNFENSDELVLGILKGKIQMQESKQSDENIIRKKIFETVKNFFESPEIAPAQPKIKPNVQPAPAQPNPRRILKPQIHPGAKPAPKAGQEVAPAQPKIKPGVQPAPAQPNPRRILKPQIHPGAKPAPKAKSEIQEDAPMNYKDDKIGGPNDDAKRNIEKRGTNPFSKIDILHKGDVQKTIEKLGDEEYKDVVDTAKKFGAENMSDMDVLMYLQKAMGVQQKHKDTLERLAKNVVQKYFGVPQDVMDEIQVKLQSNPNDIDFKVEDQDFDEEELIDDFTPEEQAIIKQNVDKRIIANTLMMGAGFKAHNLLEKIKPALDAINPELYNFYVKIMSAHNLSLWKNKPFEKGDIEIENNKITNIPIHGKSELILGDDKNGDGIREVTGAVAEATAFPVLLHETVKAVIEYIFANGLPQYTEKINRAIIKQSDQFHYEYWHKLLGPRIWKYLHDAIDFIVKGRDSDYTIVAYLLQEISMLPPDKFLRLVDLLINDGARAVVWLEKMLDRVEYDLEQQGPDEEIPVADFGNIQNLMGQIGDMLNKPIVKKEEPVQLKPFDQMQTQELKNFILKSIDAGDFEKAAEARDELEKRGE